MSESTIHDARKQGWKKPETRHGKADFDKELGIPKDSGQTWELLATIQEEEIERCVEEAIEEDQSLAAVAIVRRAGKKVRQNVSSEALRRAAANRNEKKRELGRAVAALRRAEEIKKAKARGDAVGDALVLVIAKLEPLLAAVRESATLDGPKRVKLGIADRALHEMEDALKFIANTR